MINFREFVFNELALAPLTPAVRKMVLRDGAKVAEKRRKLQQLQEQAEKADGLDSLNFKIAAERCLTEIQSLMKKVGHFELKQFDFEPTFPR
jgi:primosomal protein N''